MDYLTARGWLTARERQHLHDLAGAHGSTDRAIVNIGVEYGASLACLAAGAPPKTVIVGIDLDISKCEAHGDFALVRADSGAHSLTWNGGHIGILFVDGDHSYAGVWRDMQWLPFIPIGGVVAFHDCYAWNEPPRTIHRICPEVDQAVSEWYAHNRLNWKEIAVIDSIRTFERIALGPIIQTQNT